MNTGGLWTVSNLTALGSFAGAVATAIATFFLWRVTQQLAVETKRMADASAQPQIVALLTFNDWSTNFFDLVIENTGNAAAFDIETCFDPPLERDSEDKAAFLDMPIPYQKVSVLKPGQKLQCFLGEAGTYFDKSYLVTVSWRIHPEASERQQLVYNQDMGEIRGVSHLGERNPLTKIANEIKHIREDWRAIANGNKKIKADTYNSEDRKRAREEWEEYRKKATASTKPEITDPTAPDDGKQ